MDDMPAASERERTDKRGHFTGVGPGQAFEVHDE